MKHFFTIIAFTTLLFSTGKSQSILTVVDSISMEALPYATVYQFSGKLLFLCTNLGEIKLNIVEPDTLRVSYAGYIDKVFPVNQFKTIKVELTRNTRILPELVLKPCVKWSKAITYKPEADTGSFGGFMWGNMGDKGRIAMFLPSPGAGNKLISFILHLKQGMGASKAVAKAPIRFSFYEIDTVTMLPSELLTAKTILFQPDRFGAQKINVDSLGLVIPEQGMYIALEGYQDDAYSYWIQTNLPDGTRDKVKLYGASFEGMYSKESWLSFYNFKTGHWIFSGNKPFEKQRRHGAIKFEIKYTFCKDQKTN